MQWRSNSPTLRASYSPEPIRRGSPEATVRQVGSLSPNRQDVAATYRPGKNSKPIGPSAVRRPLDDEQLAAQQHEPPLRQDLPHGSSWGADTRQNRRDTGMQEEERAREAGMWRIFDALPQEEVIYSADDLSMLAEIIRLGELNCRQEALDTGKECQVPISCCLPGVALVVKHDKEVLQLSSHQACKFRLSPGQNLDESCASCELVWFPY